MPAAQTYSGVYVFGDSLVDPGNDLRAAQLLGSFPFVSVPNGAPTADKGYFDGRFTDGFNFADLIANKFQDSPTKPTFPFGFSAPVLGITVPFENQPTGTNLSFAYGGATAIRGDNPAPGLDEQTSIYGDNYTADPNALYVVAIGANDIRALVPHTGTPVTGAAADAAVANVALTIAREVEQLYARGVRHVVVADIPDLGVTPDYAGAPDEAMRRSLLTQYSQEADTLIRGHLDAFPLPPGGTLELYDFLGYTDSAIADPQVHGFTDVTHARTDVQAGALQPVGSGFLFFDEVHPSAQAHAQIASEIIDQLAGPNTPLDFTPAPQIGSQAASSIPLHGTGVFTATLTSGATYVIDLEGVSSGEGSLADPILRVLDASGAVIAQDDDGGLGLDSHLQFVAPATGQFTVQVQGVGATSGSYHLQAEGPNGSNLLLAGQLMGSDVTVPGGAGDDTIAAISGSNYLRGAEGNDSIAGGSGFDDINGNQGNDTIHGNAGDDWVVGGKGDDVLYGDAGNDIVLGNLGNDTLDGGDGDDVVRGGQGDDSLSGGAGNDFISGDRGNDTETGGPGADIFHSFSGAGLDLVTDFNAAEGDRVMLDPGTVYTLSQVGADTVVDMGNGDRVVLEHTVLANLPSGWIFEG
jgi:phospholipase/lecithinase/hemolysin